MLARQGTQLRPLVGTPFGLQDYRKALWTALHTGATQSVKTVFRIESSHREGRTANGTV